MDPLHAISFWLDANGFQDGATRVLGVPLAENREVAIDRIVQFICMLEGVASPSIEQVEARLFTFSYGDMVKARFSSSNPNLAGPLAHPAVRSIPITSWRDAKHLVEQIARLAIQRGEEGVLHLSQDSVGRINALKPRDVDDRPFGRSNIISVEYELTSPSSVGVILSSKTIHKTFLHVI
jgi:hypothetical protein